MAEFVEFSVNNTEQFGKLQRVFLALKKDKEVGEFRPIEEWKALFDEDDLSHFWWPSTEELAAWTARWQATPVEQRIADPSLQPPWDFASMLEAFENGEYDLLSCEMVGPEKARLEFDALAWPYGGTGCMKALVECFGFQVLAEDDGLSYKQYVN